MLKIIIPTPIHLSYWGTIRIELNRWELFVMYQMEPGTAMEEEQYCHIQNIHIANNLHWNALLD